MLNAKVPGPSTFDSKGLRNRFMFVKILKNEIMVKQ